MRILIDVGHPAHVHYFKHFIAEMERRGHAVLVTARDRQEVHALLDAYGIRYVSRGTGAGSTLGRVLYLPKADYFVYRAARRFRANFFMSFMSPYAAHASKLLGVPHIGFDDTEHSTTVFRLYKPFVDALFTPHSYRRAFGAKQFRFRGYMELCYLHPDRFTPDESVRETLGVGADERYAIVRFIKFGAVHDKKLSGFSTANRIRLVKALQKHLRVFISSEGALPEELEPYRLPTRAEQIHDAMYYADLYIGDSVTMATEAACLGTPSIRCGGVAKTEEDVGNFVELEDYGLVSLFHSSEQEEAISEALKLAAQPDAKAVWARRRQRLMDGMVDVTALMVWAAETFPESLDTLRDLPGQLVQPSEFRDGSTVTGWDHAPLDTVGAVS